jgi:hypothetical protein
MQAMGWLARNGHQARAQRWIERADDSAADVRPEDFVVAHTNGARQAPDKGGEAHVQPRTERETAEELAMRGISVRIVSVEYTMPEQPRPTTGTLAWPDEPPVAAPKGDVK